MEPISLSVPMRPIDSIRNERVKRETARDTIEAGKRCRASKRNGSVTWEFFLGLCCPVYRADIEFNEPLG